MENLRDSCSVDIVSTEDIISNVESALKFVVLSIMEKNNIYSSVSSTTVKDNFIFKEKMYKIIKDKIETSGNAVIDIVEDIIEVDVREDSILNELKLWAILSIEIIFKESKEAPINELIDIVKETIEYNIENTSIDTIFDNLINLLLSSIKYDKNIGDKIIATLENTDILLNKHSVMLDIDDIDDIKDQVISKCTI